jgi:uncharacterized membrane protein
MAAMHEEALTPPRSLGLARIGFAIAVAVASVLLGAWLLLTPGGLLGKADAIGYAVCHRIDLRSFHLGERPLPLCARCSGTYLGVLVALGTLIGLGRGRSGSFPRWPILALFGVFGLIFAIDGVNSYLHFFPNAPHLYEPSNTLRLVSGMLLGLGMGVLVYTGFNQAVWKDWLPQPALRRWRDVAVLLVAAGGMVLLILWENPLVLYPLAIASALSVLGLLAVVYTVMAVIVLRRENRASKWRDLALPGLVGFSLALAQIAAIDWIRFAATQTWNGFVL